MFLNAVYRRKRRRRRSRKRKSTRSSSWMCCPCFRLLHEWLLKRKTWGSAPFQASLSDRWQESSGYIHVAWLWTGYQFDQLHVTRGNIHTTVFRFVLEKRNSFPLGEDDTRPGWGAAPHTLRLPGAPPGGCSSSRCLSRPCVAWSDGRARTGVPQKCRFLNGGRAGNFFERKNKDMHVWNFNVINMCIYI